jgi:type IV pilus assembly protein PilQ
LLVIPLLLRLYRHLKLPKTLCQLAKVEGLDFHRGSQNDGQINIRLSNPAIPVDVQQQGNKIIARFIGAKIPENLRRRLDVNDFATPIKTIDAYNEGNNGVMIIQPQGEFEYLAYQADNNMTISVKPVLPDAPKSVKSLFTQVKSYH